MHLRLFLDELFNHLSDTDRILLHSNVGSLVPYEDQIDFTPTGSRRLVRSLFDRKIISEKNFDYLIEVFEKMNRFEAAEKLRKYKQSYEYSSVAHENEKNHDKNQSKYVIAEWDRSSYNTSTVKTVSGAFDRDGKANKSLQLISKRKSTEKRYLYLIIIFLSMALVLNELSHFYRSYSMSEIHVTSTQSKDNVVPIESVYILEEGIQYGNQSIDSSVSFNDANDLKLYYTDHCIEVHLSWSNDSLNFIQFFYSNKNHSLSMIFNDSYAAFILQPNEKIYKINIYEDPHREIFTVVGIQFYTTYQRKSRVFGSRDGKLRTESFQSYTFAYARGRQIPHQGIAMLQFFWMKEDAIKQYMKAVAHPLVEICEFTFTSKIDYALVHVKGIESSWYELKTKYERQGSHCHPEAFYYEKISPRGPKLFAVVSNDTVYYHDNNEWFKYQSAVNIKCYLSPSMTNYS